MGDLLPWGGIFQPWSRTGLVYDRVGAEFSEAHSLSTCLRFEAPVLRCYMLPLWGSSGAAPPRLFPFSFLIFSHLTLSLTNFQGSLLHHLFQLISYPWSAQKFQLFFTFSDSAIDSFHSLSLFSLSLQSQVFVTPVVLHRKSISGHNLGASKKTTWVISWLWFKAMVSYVICNFFKPGRRKPRFPNPFYPDTEMLGCTILCRCSVLQ